MALLLAVCELHCTEKEEEHKIGSIVVKCWIWEEKKRGVRACMCECVLVTWDGTVNKKEEKGEG